MATQEEIEAALIRLAEEIGNRVAAGVPDDQRERVLAEVCGGDAARQAREAIR